MYFKHFKLYTVTIWHPSSSFCNYFITIYPKRFSTFKDSRTTW